MDESKAIEYLMHFGMSRQEATVYLRLIEAGKQTGYEIARDTGISRSNVYASLAALVEKGAAYLVEEDAKRYIPVHVQEFCGNRIRRMEVLMNGEQSGLKEILSEVGEELRVHLYGKVEAMLWFPEYYEEGVENTPARILMTEVHGSGLYYRNCFQGKVFHFLEYDKRFEMARAQESSDFLREMVYGRLNWPTGLTEQAKIQYEQYLKEHIEQIASDFIRQKRGEELEWLLHTYPLEQGQKELFTGLVNLADTVKSPEILSMLMEYQRLHFPSKRRSFEL